MRTGETPVPIPNTTVKTCAADGTMLETAWESRWMPGLYGGVAQLGEHLPCKQGVKSSNLSISTRDCTLQFGNKVSSLACRHVMKTKHYEGLWKQAFNAFETFCFRNVPWKLHIENLIQSSNWKVWNKYQDIRGVTRKCNQTNQKQAIINCKHHKPKMQRYASERNTVPAVWINWLS